MIHCTISLLRQLGYGLMLLSNPSSRAVAAACRLHADCAPRASEPSDVRPWVQHDDASAPQQCCGHLLSSSDRCFSARSDCALWLEPSAVCADKNPKGTERFKLVSEAFAVLSDPAARSEYDYNASNARFRVPAGPERYQDFPAGPMGQSTEL